MAETIIKYSDNDSVTDYANSVIELQEQEISRLQRQQNKHFRGNPVI